MLKLTCLLILLLVFACVPLARADQECPPGQEPWYTGTFKCDWIPAEAGGPMFDCYAEWECVAPWLLQSVPVAPRLINPAFTLPKSSELPKRQTRLKLDDPACSACHNSPPPQPKQYGLCNDPEEAAPCEFSGVR